MSSKKEKNTSALQGGMAILVIDASGVVTFAEGMLDALGLNDSVASCAPALEVFRASPAIIEKIQDAMAGRAGCIEIGRAHV